MNELIAAIREAVEAGDFDLAAHLTAGLNAIVGPWVESLREDRCVSA